MVRVWVERLDVLLLRLHRLLEELGLLREALTVRLVFILFHDGLLVHLLQPVERLLRRVLVVLWLRRHIGCRGVHTTLLASGLLRWLLLLLLSGGVVSERGLSRLGLVVNGASVFGRGLRHVLAA